MNKKVMDAVAVRALLDDMEKKTGFTVSPNEAAGVLGCDPYSLTVAAKSGNLGSIRHFWAGNNLRISRLDVLSFCGRHPLQMDAKQALPWEPVR